MGSTVRKNCNYFHIPHSRQNLCKNNNVACNVGSCTAAACQKHEIATKITPLRPFVFSVQPLVLSQGQLQKGLYLHIPLHLLDLDINRVGRQKPRGGCRVLTLFCSRNNRPSHSSAG